MTHYSEDESSVRVDFWKTGVGSVSGQPYLKWGYTEAVVWTGKYRDSVIHDEFIRSLKDHFIKTGRPRGMEGLMAICMEPYHEHSHPIAVLVEHDSERWRKVEVG